MAALRTQIYLTQEQRMQLDTLRRARGASLAELIREAVDDFLGREQLDPKTALDLSFGAVPDAVSVPRGEWSGRA